MPWRQHSAPGGERRGCPRARMVEALTGAKSVDLNVVACHGGDVAAGVARGLEVVASARVPAVIMPPDRRSAARSCSSPPDGCIGGHALYGLHGRRGSRRPLVRKLREPELAEARSLVARAFELPSDPSLVTVPDRAGAEAPPRHGVSTRTGQWSAELRRSAWTEVGLCGRWRHPSVFEGGGAVGALGGACCAFARPYTRVHRRAFSG